MEIGYKRKTAPQITGGKDDLLNKWYEYSMVDLQKRQKIESYLKVNSKINFT